MAQSGESGKEELPCGRTEPSPNVSSWDLSAAFIAPVDESCLFNDTNVFQF